MVKLITLGGAIIGGFLIVKFLTSHPFFAIPPVVLCFEAFINHFVIFDKVYRITDKVEELKDRILEKANSPKQNVRVRDEYTKFCKSVQRPGIQAGGFYVLQRENTLIFMDYVINQIVSLVLTFQ